MLDQLIQVGGGIICSRRRTCLSLDRNRAHFSGQRLVELASRIDIIETYNPWCEPEANHAAAELAADKRVIESYLGLGKHR